LVFLPPLAKTMTDKKIKIVHLFYILGGVGTSIELIAKNTDEDQFEHVIIDGSSQDIKTSKGIKKIYKVGLDREIHPVQDFKLLLKLIKICKKEKPDLIHAHSSKAGILGKIVAFITGKRCLHTPQAYSFLSTQNKLKKKLYLLIEKTLKILPHKILASSQSEAHRALNEVGYPLKRVITFPNAINPINKVPDLSIEKQWPDEYLCTVGRPSYQKNIELMIDVINQLKKEKPKIHLVIMGVGSYSPNTKSVEEKIAYLGLQQNITLLKWTSRNDIFRIINDAKLYISTARYEGLPYAVVESLALGKALVLSNADGNRDLIEDGKNGFLIFDDNIEIYKQRIIDLLNYKEKCLAFEQHSKKLFNEQFNINNTIKNLETIYKNESL
jgi:glycosyltransferase involved in cell wall biosynthesis